jgi:hypothetical protein
MQLSLCIHPVSQGTAACFTRGLGYNRHIRYAGSTQKQAGDL